VTDPKRWSDAEQAATPLEQLLTRAGQDLPMPSGLKDAVWSRIVGILPPLPQGPRPSHRATLVGKGSSLLAPVALKAVGLAVAVIGFGAIGRYLLVASTETIPVASTTPATTSTFEPRIESIALPSNDPLPAQPLTASVSPPPTPSVGHPGAPSHASQLREESQAVLAARQALRSNDAAAALRLLEQARQRFGSGALAEEREVLTIEALAKSGDGVRAAERAKTFLRTHPRSPYAADVQRHVAQ
jgi:hypothetical protein